MCSLEATSAQGVQLLLTQPATGWSALVASALIALMTIPVLAVGGRAAERPPVMGPNGRSEERRVGKECRL